MATEFNTNKDVTKALFRTLLKEAILIYVSRTTNLEKVATTVRSMKERVFIVE